MKKLLSLSFALMLLCCTACTQQSSTVQQESSAVQSEAEEKPDSNGKTKDDTKLYQKYAKMAPEDVTAQLTLEQKAQQMLQAAVYLIQPGEMKKNDYGCIISTAGLFDVKDWRGMIDKFQENAVESPAGVPYIYGMDHIHGVGYCVNAVIFPHNIGIGAANDPDLTYQAGVITAKEARATHMIWNFSPVVAQSADPRWGRTYECYGSDLERITELSTAYTRGLIEGGAIACAKHFFADGNVKFGTGEQSDIKRLIDRGDAQLSDDEISKLLDVYQAQIDAGVQTIMVSHSSLNGVKMHENAEYLQKLRTDMGFEGLIVGDWDSIYNTSAETYYDRVVAAVNAGVDMLMEVDHFEMVSQYIVDAVNRGDIKESRVDEAVTRIIRMKQDAGLFDDPFLSDAQGDTGAPESRGIAEQLVEKSLVLLKNEDGTLPLKSGTKLYITGPAADNARVQCGGWTLQWNADPELEIKGVTTLKQGFEQKAEQYGITLTDTPEDADVILLAVGERSYEEWNGDTEEPALCGELGCNGNAKAIEEAKATGKPVVTCIIAGRNVFLEDADLDSWDSAVMCYLPGSEGQGIADVLCGGSPFTGKLPSPWYRSADEIGTENARYPAGYGLEYE